MESLAQSAQMQAGKEYTGARSLSLSLTPYPQNIREQLQVKRDRIAAQLQDADIAIEESSKSATP